MRAAAVVTQEKVFGSLFLDQCVDELSSAKPPFAKSPGDHADSANAVQKPQRLSNRPSIWNVLRTADRQDLQRLGGSYLAAL
jgi:hypothetical protein